jgi:hypothetical protein
MRDFTICSLKDVKRGNPELYEMPAPTKNINGLPDTVTASIKRLFRNSFEHIMFPIADVISYDNPHSVFGYCQFLLAGQ